MLIRCPHCNNFKYVLITGEFREISKSQLIDTDKEEEKINVQTKLNITDPVARHTC